VIVDDPNIVGIAIDEPKADAPLIVDRDRVLSPSVTFERMESIAGWHSKIIQARGKIHVLQLARRPSQNV
jgi:hypothetical protein